LYHSKLSLHTEVQRPSRHAIIRRLRTRTGEPVEPGKLAGSLGIPESREIPEGCRFSVSLQDNRTTKTTPFANRSELPLKQFMLQLSLTFSFGRTFVSPRFPPFYTLLTPFAVFAPLN
jgi:hypothetical protein